MSIIHLGCRAFLIAIVVLPITLCAQAVDANTASNQSTATASQRLVSSYQAPTPKEQFRRYMISAYGPLAFLRAGVAAGIDQARNTPEEWGQGAARIRKTHRITIRAVCHYRNYALWVSLCPA